MMNQMESLNVKQIEAKHHHQYHSEPHAILLIRICGFWHMR